MKLRLLLICLVAIAGLSAQAQADKKWKHDIVVAQDGSGDYTNITDALEGIRAYMDYNVTVNIKNGTYKEKIVIPSWLKNVTFIGENPDSTIITFDHHANINNMGTFRTPKATSCNSTTAACSVIRTQSSPAAKTCVYILATAISRAQPTLFSVPQPLILKIVPSIANVTHTSLPLPPLRM